MKSIKVLQTAVVAMFVTFALVGLGLLFLGTDKIPAYGQLVQILFPLFLAQVIPALIGSPLTEYVRARAAKVTASIPMTTTPGGPADGSMPGGGG